MKRVKVIWRDIQASTEAWSDKDDLCTWAEKAYDDNMETVGYLLKKTKRYIVIAATADHEGKQYGDASMIPRGVIKEIVEL